MLFAQRSPTPTLTSALHVRPSVRMSRDPLIGIGFILLTVYFHGSTFKLCLVVKPNAKPRCLEQLVMVRNDWLTTRCKKGSAVALSGGARILGCEGWLACQ